MTTRLPLVLASSAILAAALALSGCSAPGGSAAGPQGGSSGDGTVTTTDAGAGQATDGSKVCSLASVADAQGALRSDPALAVQVEGEVDKGGIDCGYASDDRSILLQVIVYPDASDFTLGAGVMSTEPLTPVDGIGDKAAAGDFELAAVVGGKGLVVMSVGPTDVSRDQVIDLARLVASRIK